MTGRDGMCARLSRALFSDRRRPAGLLAALALLAGLGLHAARAPHWRCDGPGACLDRPGPCDGRTFTAGPVRIAAVTPEGFTILSGRGPLAFRGDFPELAPGRYADVEAVFRAPDRFEALAVHVHLERAVKIWGSLAAALVVVWLVARAWLRGRF